MNAQTLSLVEKLYGRYAQATECGDKRKLWATLAELLTAHFTFQERQLRARTRLSLGEFRAHYLAARAFSDVRKLEMSSPMFEVKLAALCSQLGATNIACNEQMLQAA